MLLNSLLHLTDSRQELFNLNCKLINFIHDLKERCGLDRKGEPSLRSVHLHISIHPLLHKYHNITLTRRWSHRFNRFHEDNQVSVFIFLHAVLSVQWHAYNNKRVNRYQLKPTIKTSDECHVFWAGLWLCIPDGQLWMWPLTYTIQTV